MNDAEFEAFVREAQKRLGDELRNGRRERRHGHLVITVRQEDGDPVRPLSIDIKRNFDVKP